MTKKEFWEKIKNPTTFDANKLAHELWECNMNWNTSIPIAEITSKISKQELDQRLFTIEQWFYKMPGSAIGFAYSISGRAAEKVLTVRTFD
jgi:hypothetical protein